MSDDVERLLGELRFRPRDALGPEIAGRARRGEAPPPPPARVPRWLLLGAAVSLAAAIAWGARALAPAARRADHCCANLDGGPAADDGYVVESRGRRIVRLTLYEDLDRDGRLSDGDRVRLVRGDAPALAPDSVQASTRLCCADLDGEGAADDGLLVLHGADERVVLAGVFERRGGVDPATLR